MPRKLEEPVEKYIIVGKLGKTHGVRGWLNLYSETQPAENILEYKPLFWMTDSGWQEINATEIKPHGKNFLVHVAGIDNSEIAKKYTGKEIAILRDQLPNLKSDEFYWTDLEGLTVINQKNIELGVIDHLMETKANDVMVVIGKKKHLIPFIRNQVVIDIDLDAKVMHVNWDEDF